MDFNLRMESLDYFYPSFGDVYYLTYFYFFYGDFGLNYFYYLADYFVYRNYFDSATSFPYFTF